MSHLTRDELLVWRDAPGQADRRRVVEHLAACDECCALHAELIRTRPAEMPPSAFDQRAFVEHGYAIARRQRSRVLAFRPRVWVPLAAAAAVLLVMWLPGSRQALDTIVETGVVRGGRIQAVTPVGEIEGAIEFRWASPVSADRYAVEVTDASGQRVFYRETRAESLAGGADSAALRPGVRYTWTVRALDAGGEAISQSAPAAFIRAARPLR